MKTETVLSSDTRMYHSFVDCAIPTTSNYFYNISPVDNNQAGQLNNQGPTLYRLRTPTCSDVLKFFCGQRQRTV